MCANVRELQIPTSALRHVEHTIDMFGYFGFGIEFEIDCKLLTGHRSQLRQLRQIEAQAEHGLDGYSSTTLNCVGAKFYVICPS